jgi:hypothetical protein
LKLDSFGTTPDFSDVYSHFVLPLMAQLYAALPYQPLKLRDAIKRGDPLCIIKECTDALWDVDTPEYHLGVRTIRALLEKNTELHIPGIDPARAAAIEARRCEIDCELENELLLSLLGQSRKVSPLKDYALRANSYIYDVARKISEILGAAPKLSELKMRFGPGATVNLSKKKANVVTKLSLVEKTCSKSILPLVNELCEEFPHLAPEIRKCVPAPAKIAFVEKNYKTHRPIAVEPWLNTLVQLGIGDYMAKRLRFFGVDIRDQSMNQRLARYGSMTNAVSTIDLSSASDTISYELVRQLMPPDWFALLVRARSDENRVGKFVFRPSKFSSMGNGFTFPLETLIFHCISLVAAERTARSTFFCSTYGDDMIVPTESFALTVDILNTFGFRVNVDKSFTGATPFRESCGKDYMRGHSVRPTYLWDNQIAKYLFAAHNRYDGTRYAAIFKRFVYACCRDFLLWGPPEMGDGHLHTRTPEKVFKKTHLERGFGGYTFKTYVYATDTSRLDLTRYRMGQLVHLYLIYADGPSDWLHGESMGKLDRNGLFLTASREGRWIERTLYTY